jgi:hypothetical protein
MFTKILSNGVPINFIEYLLIKNHFIHWRNMFVSAGCDGEAQEEQVEHGEDRI